MNILEEKENNVKVSIKENSTSICLDATQVLMAVSKLLTAPAHKRKFDAETTIYFNDDETEGLTLDFLTTDIVYFNEETGDEIYLDNVIFYSNFGEDNNDQ